MYELESLEGEKDLMWDNEKYIRLITPEEEKELELRLAMNKYNI